MYDAKVCHFHCRNIIKKYYHKSKKLFVIKKRKLSLLDSCKNKFGFDLFIVS